MARVRGRGRNSRIVSFTNSHRVGKRGGPGECTTAWVGIVKKAAAGNLLIVSFVNSEEPRGSQRERRGLDGSVKNAGRYSPGRLWLHAGRPTAREGS